MRFRVAKDSGGTSRMMLHRRPPAPGSRSTVANALPVPPPARATSAEAVSALRRYADRVDLDPQRLGEVESRIDAVLSCARKYRTVPDELPDLLERWQGRLSVLGETADVAALEEKVQTARKHYEALAGKLSKARAAAAIALGKDVSKVMQQLALAGGRFEVALLL